jgi:hypothetical protein
MELDDIKKLWNEVDLLKEKQEINENKIKEMLKDKGKTALSKLIRLEIIGIFAALPSGAAWYFLSSKFFAIGGYYVILPFIILLLCVLCVPLYIYLYRLLKSIDYYRMTARENLEKILKYQRIYQKIYNYSMYGFVIFISIWICLDYIQNFGLTIYWGRIIFAIILIIVGTIAGNAFYKKWYFDRINQIKESLKELKEFEK